MVVHHGNVNRCVFQMFAVKTRNAATSRMSRVGVMFILFEGNNEISFLPDVMCEFILYNAM